MRINRRYMMAGATFVLAASIGHIMQNGAGLVSHIAGQADEAAMEPIVTGDTQLSPDTPVTRLSADLGLSGDPLMPVLPSGPEIGPLTPGDSVQMRKHVPQTDRGVIRVKSAADDEFTAFGLACAPATLSVGAAPGAMLDVALTVPCNAGETVALRHGEMEIMVLTDAEGGAKLHVPALAADGAISVTLASGRVLNGIAAVGDLDEVSRVALVWQGHAAFSLHAYEAGAEFGGKGHLSAATATDFSAETDSALGMLGYAAPGQPAFAQVYSSKGATTETRFEIAAAVDAATCGREVAGQVIRLQGGVRDISAITLAMPGCDAIGDSVVMPLSFDDLEVEVARAETQ